MSVLQLPGQTLRDLQEENIYLRRQLALEIDAQRRLQFCRALRLTLAEGIIFAALYEARGRPIQKDRLADLLPMRSGGERGEINIVAVYVSHIRSALGRSAILTTAGGFMLSDLGASLARAVLELAAASEDVGP